MFKRVLIANRGEIARRILRACRALGVETVAVYSEADREWPHVKEADRSILIGPAPARESYLCGDRVIEAARETKAEAIHPGYGFLSESWRFASMCEEAGIRFIGPPWPVLKRMGEKTEARRLMASAGVPVVPGSEKPLTTLKEARADAEVIGYPVLVKAAGGGGGIGMAKAEDPAQLDRAFLSAQRRASAAFGSGELYLERYLDHLRHVEVQVVGDSHGRIVHLYERECSIQRRHQKLIEESPAPGLSPSVKRRLTEAALAGAGAAGYVNAGTLEFLVRGEGMYFLEMNARLQVEHPVTEEVTGIDLVGCQLAVAAGERLPWIQEEIAQEGVAIECRIYAEDPDRNFMPSPGRITALRLPRGEGVRVECGIEEGVEVSVHYDPLLAKVIARGKGRDEALARMAEALDQFSVEGVKTTLGFHRTVLASRAFREGAMHTQMVEQGAFNG